MHTEHNYPELFYPVIFDGTKLLFLDGDRVLTDKFEDASEFFGTEDAINWAIRSGHPEHSILIARLPLRLEYQDKHEAYWQRQRYYADKKSAFDAWPGQLDKAKRAGFIAKMRIVNIDNNKTIKEWQRQI